jgi:hypothetical protein
MSQQDYISSQQEVSTDESSSLYHHRCCPCCGSKPPARPEIATPVEAAKLSFKELIPQWNGFFKEKSIFAYTRCSTCGLLYAPEFFDNDQLSSLYAQMPPNMDEVPLSALKATQRGYFEALKRHSSLTGGFMEMGPDIGLFTENCVREGDFSKYWLLEPNRTVEEALALVVKDKPYHIIQDLHGFSQVPERSATVAVMIHVLDHLLDPVPMLQRLRKTLTPDATLLIVTHNESSLLRRVTGSRWPAFCLQHPQIYNPQSIRKVLDAAGFDVLEVRKTVNYFEVRFLVKHLLWTIGWRTHRVPSFGHAVVGLKLGNMLTVARSRGAEN